MKIINLRDFYASLYSHDCICEVSDEVAELLAHFKSREQSQIRQRYKHRAHYSLDRDDGIENEILFFAPSAQEVYERKAEHMALYIAMQSLTDKQLRRLYACFFLDMSYAKIARLERVDESTVRKSVNSALVRLSKIIDFFD